MKRIKRAALALSVFPLLFALLLSLVSCSGLSKKEKAEQKPVATCGDYEILYEELRFVTLNAKEKEGVKDLTGDAYRKALEETVLADLLANYKVLAACKKALPDLTIEDESVQSRVEAYLKASIDSFDGDKDAFFQATEEQLHATEHFLRFTLAVSAMEEELGKKLAGMSETQFSDWILAGNGVCVQHVLVKARADADLVQRNLADGTWTIDHVIGETHLNADLSNTTPYYVVRGVYDKAMEDAAFALTNVGDVSPVVESERGYYIFVRMEDTGNLLLVSHLSQMFDSYCWSVAEDAANAETASLTVTWNDYGKSIDLVTLE